MKNLTLLAVSALALCSACTQDGDHITAASAPQNSEPTPLTFSTYTGRYANTRAQQTGIMTDATLQTTGFGVFAYHSDNGSYSSSLTPNFMWNQQVTYSSSTWSYSPIKYWPNEFGTKAQSTGTDKLSFFAYAPYVKTTDTGGTELSSSPTDYTSTDGGITAISANNATGDPKISYTSALDPSKSVDLLWAVNDTYVSSETGYTGPTASAWYASESGKPYLNMDKMPIDKKINFTFKHALTRLGITVQGMFDQVNSTGTSDKSTDDVATSSIIMIESVTIGGPYRWKGKLNLNNTTANTALWEDQEVTRTAAPSDQSSLELINTATSGKQTIATSLAYTSGTAASGYAPGSGVTKDRKDIFTGDVIDGSNDNRQYYMFVPQQAAGATTVTVKYHVITDDIRLNGGKIDITNEITKTLPSGTLDFSSGKANDLNLVLGLTTVDMQATVTEWPAATEQAIDLPVNSTMPTP